MHFAVLGQSNDELIAKKALYIRNFCLFTTWPIDSPAKLNKEYFTIAIFGNCPNLEKLKQSLATESIKDRKVVIKCITKVEEIAGCDLLFVQTSQQSNLAAILSTTKKLPILVLSDLKGSAEKGVHIVFYETDEKIAFEINESAVKESGLHMSYLLLKEAHIVNPLRN
jgi:hypothetical protein